MKRLINYLNQGKNFGKPKKKKKVSLKPTNEKLPCHLTRKVSYHQVWNRLIDGFGKTSLTSRQGPLDSVSHFLKTENLSLSLACKSTTLVFIDDALVPSPIQG